MIRLDRARVGILATWSTHVQMAFPSLTAFLEKAEAFERLDIDDPIRRAGFKAYAPEVLPSRGRRGDRDFRAIWGRAKRAIAAMSHRKCAYCETPLTAERTAVVEHFRPKSLFPSLVYDWANYFLGCGGCNGAKWNRWPEGGVCYVRPDEDDPAMLFLFREDGRMEPLDLGGSAEITIQDLDLNRKWLVRRRALRIRETLAELTNVLDEEEIPEEAKFRLVRRALDRLQNPELEYLAAVRQCFERALRERSHEKLP
ncbi:MAG TPA: hypothetical protein VLQ45_16715 [Thermoanaerobaculia bacterium]|nr:hypothetical protein [Thermoanaerobaculia bacterium]